MSLPAPPTARLARYLAVMRWFAADALRAEGWRIAASTAAELLGFACKVSALGGLLVFIRKLQVGGTYHVLGHSWSVDSATTVLVAGAAIAATFALGGALAYFARSSAIDVVSACSRRWLDLALSAVKCASAGKSGPSGVRLASLAGQDALVAGRVAWQFVRGAASVVTGIWLAIGMLWLEPMLTAAVAVIGTAGLAWQYRASVRGAKGTRDLERATLSMRQAWVRELGPSGSPGAGTPSLPAEFDEVVRLRADQLRVIEQGGLASGGVMALLLGGVVIYFGWEASRMSGRWDLVIAYAIALRSLVGILDSNARRIVAIHRLYPSLSRYWLAVVVGASDAIRLPAAASAGSDEGDLQFDDLET